MRKISTLAVLPLLAMLAGCGEPTPEELAAAMGYRSVSDVACAAASGKPGYVCQYTVRGQSASQRVVKADDGRWRMVDY